MLYLTRNIALRQRHVGGLKIAAGRQLRRCCLSRNRFSIRSACLRHARGPFLAMPCRPHCEMPSPRSAIAASTWEMRGHPSIPAAGHVPRVWGLSMFRARAISCPQNSNVLANLPGPSAACARLLSPTRNSAGTSRAFAPPFPRCENAASAIAAKTKIAALHAKLLLGSPFTKCHPPFSGPVNGFARGLEPVCI